MPKIARLPLLFLLIVLFSALVPACSPAEPLPTLAVIPTEAGANNTTQVPSALPPTTTASSTITPTPTPTLTPRAALPTSVPTEPPTLTPTAGPLDASAVRFETVTAKLLKRRLTFIVRLTPLTQRVGGVTLTYSYPSTGETKTWKATLPPQTIGQAMNAIEHSFSVDELPPNEALIDYRWQVTGQNGGVLESEPKTFKITEAITAERRDDLPAIEADLSFESQFPDRAFFRVSLTPKVPISNARIFYTQNRGLVLHDYRVSVPTLKAGQKLELQFQWDKKLALQIPWQQFEWWWVFRDMNNKEWRTKSMFSEYSDKSQNWTRTEGPRSVLFTYGQNKANINTLLKATEDSISRLEKAFGYALLYSPHIVVYNNRRDFMVWAPPSLSERFIGLASGEWGGAVVAYTESIEYTGEAIIQHELTHLFQYQSIREDQAPKWFIEGSARYFETVGGEYIEEYVRALTAIYGAPNLQYRVDERSPDGLGDPWPYSVGKTAITFLREKYGPDVFETIHKALARDIRFDAAIKMATGDTLERISNAWGAWIKQ